MSTEGLAKEDDLVTAVRSLIEEVKLLNQKMALYAPREEVRRDSRQRAWRFFGFAVVVIVLAQLLSMSTISYCFLNTSSQNKPMCSVMPGYNAALRDGEVRLARFELLTTTIDRNRLQIAELQARVDKLESQKG